MPTNNSFEALELARSVTSAEDLPASPAEAVARFWGRAILGVVLDDASLESSVAGIPGFVNDLSRDISEALKTNPDLLRGTPGRAVLGVNGKPSVPLANKALKNDISPEAFPLKSTTYDDGNGTIYGHIGVDDDYEPIDIEQIWPPQTVEANNQIDIIA